MIDRGKPTSYDEAFRQGYRDCKENLSSAAATSFTSSSFSPPDGFREAYRLGWEKAASETAVAYGRSDRRWAILGPFLIGGILLAFGLAVTLGTIFAGGGVLFIAYGAIVSGIASLIKGFVTLFRRGRESPSEDA